MKTYRAAVIGCSRMGAFIDNETVDDHPYVRPYSHAAGFEACERTDLVACSDLRPNIMDEFGRRYGVPTERQYTDYREMIEREDLHIVSVATHPEQRAEIVLHAAEHGVPAIYAEKPMAASMSEADAMVEAVERNGVVFNLGTRRRYYTGFEAMKRVIDGGELGALKSLVIQRGAGLFGHGSHFLDLTLYLNGDEPAVWVQGQLLDGDSAFEGDIVVEDPSGHGIIQFRNGVTGYLVSSPHRGQYEAVCEGGTVAVLNDRRDFRLRRLSEAGDGSGQVLVDGRFPDFVAVSPTTRIIEDLVHALDTGEPPRGGVRAARAGTELIFAFLESHLRRGARVDLPLRECSLRLQRPAREPRPKFTA